MDIMELSKRFTDMDGSFWGLILKGVVAHWLAVSSASSWIYERKAWTVYSDRRFFLMGLNGPGGRGRRLQFDNRFVIKTL